MASVAADADSDATTSDAEPPLQVDSISTVDLRLLSQFELFALSQCSDVSFDPRRCDDVVVPTIDRSVFNESAGSRKQTYSRLRLAPAGSDNWNYSAICRRAPHLRSPKLSSSNYVLEIDPENGENTQIIGLMKKLFGGGSVSISDGLFPVPVYYSDSLPQLPQLSPRLSQLSNVISNVVRRKRGRPRKGEKPSVSVPVPIPAPASAPAPVAVEVKQEAEIKDIVVCGNAEDGDKEILNCNGMVVDLAALASLKDPYGMELRRRTEGLGTEEELLGFLEGLNGLWSSKRKKIVEATEFGDALPKGWKLLLSVKKKEGSVLLCCRRYISPNGWQFASCKEVSTYMFSILGLQDVNRQSNEGIPFDCNVTSRNTADFTVQDASKHPNIVCQSVSSVSSISGCFENQVTLNTSHSEVTQVEYLKCHICNITFVDKDEFLRHQLSSHRGKRSRTGASITDGLIIKGGKYECQFCHKTFSERHRYNGHMGAHVKNQARSEEAAAVKCAGAIADILPCSGVPQNELFLQVSMGADYHALTQTYDGNVNDVLNSNFYSKSEEISSQETCIRKFDCENNCLAQDKQDMQVATNGKVLVEEFDNKQDRDSIMISDGVGRIDEAVDISGSKSYNSCMGSGVTLSYNEKSSNWNITVEESVIRSLSSGMGESFIEHKKSLESPLLSPVPRDEKSSVENRGTGVSASLEGSNQDAVSKEDFVSVNNKQNVYAMTNERDRTAEFSSLLTGNEQRFGMDDNATRSYNSSSEECKQAGSENHLVIGSSVRETSDDAYNVNKIYGDLECELEVVQTAGTSTLTIAFVNAQLDLVSDPSDLGRERFSENCPVDLSGIEQTFCAHGDLSGVNNGIMEDPEQGRESTIGLLRYCNGKTNYSENTIFPGKVWKQPRLDDSENNKFMAGFGSSWTEHNEGNIAGGMWRTGRENVLQSGLGSTSNLLTPSSNSSHNLNMISDKDKSNILGVNEKCDSQSGFQGPRSGRNEPVGSTFLTMQNLNSFAEDPKGFPYNTEMVQGFNSTFWLGKDALMPNGDERNQDTTLCVWCRNEFYQVPIPSGPEAGAIGSVCPTCSSRNSERLNV